MNGDKVEAGQTIATWDPHTRPIVTEHLLVKQNL